MPIPDLGADTTLNRRKDGHGKSMSKIHEGEASHIQQGVDAADKEPDSVPERSRPYLDPRLPILHLRRRHERAQRQSYLGSGQQTNCQSNNANDANHRVMPQDSNADAQIQAQDGIDLGRHLANLAANSGSDLTDLSFNPSDSNSFRSRHSSYESVGEDDYDDYDYSPDSNPRSPYVNGSLQGQGDSENGDENLEQENFDQGNFNQDHLDQQNMDQENLDPEFEDEGEWAAPIPTWTTEPKPAPFPFNVESTWFMLFILNLLIVANLECEHRFIRSRGIHTYLGRILFRACITASIGGLTHFVQVFILRVLEPIRLAIFVHGSNLIVQGIARLLGLQLVPVEPDADPANVEQQLMGWPLELPRAMFQLLRMAFGALVTFTWVTLIYSVTIQLATLSPEAMEYVIPFETPKTWIAAVVQPFADLWLHYDPQTSTVLEGAYDLAGQVVAQIGFVVIVYDFSWLFFAKMNEARVILEDGNREVNFLVAFALCQHVATKMAYYSIHQILCFLVTVWQIEPEFGPLVPTLALSSPYQSGLSSSGLLSSPPVRAGESTFVFSTSRRRIAISLGAWSNPTHALAIFLIAAVVYSSVLVITRTLIRRSWSFAAPYIVWQTMWHDWGLDLSREASIEAMRESLLVDSGSYMEWFMFALFGVRRSSLFLRR
jgi:hypothetical protein